MTGDHGQADHGQAHDPSGFAHAARSAIAPLATTRRMALVLFALALLAGVPDPSKAAGANDQLTWGVHVSLAPTWFDPAEMSGIITPYLVYYALHECHAGGQVARARVR